MRKPEDLQVQLSLAGLSLDGRRLPPRSWPAPRNVEIRTVAPKGSVPQPALSCLWELPYRHVRAGQRMLQGFVDLVDAPDEEILRYARRWGPLGLCVHGLPRSHHRTFDWVTGTRFEMPACELPRDRRSTGAAGPVHVELLASWRAFAGEARAILRIAAALQRGRPGKAEDWAVVPEFSGCVAWASSLVDLDGWRHAGEVLSRKWRPGRLLEDPGAQRQILGRAVSRWLQLGDVRLDVTWNDRDPTAEIGHGGLFGALALELLLSVSRLDGLAICSACGLGYVPSRKPVAGKCSYCPACGRAAAMRAASARYYARKKQRGLRSSPGDRPSPAGRPRAAGQRPGTARRDDDESRP